jgi:hypothetical protein
VRVLHAQDHDHRSAEAAARRAAGPWPWRGRRAGYREIVLWTNDVLHAARRIYQRAGFQLAGSSPHHSFGHDLVEEDWRLPLT